MQFLSSLFVDKGLESITADTGFLKNQQAFVAVMRPDVSRSVIRSIVLDYCEEKQFRILFETNVEVELDQVKRVCVIFALNIVTLFSLSVCLF
jgi:hypothetical protein